MTWKGSRKRRVTNAARPEGQPPHAHTRVPHAPQHRQALLTAFPFPSPPPPRPAGTPRARPRATHVGVGLQGQPAVRLHGGGTAPAADSASRRRAQPAPGTAPPRREATGGDPQREPALCLSSHTPLPPSAAAKQGGESRHDRLVIPGCSWMGITGGLSPRSLLGSPPAVGSPGEATAGASAAPPASRSRHGER